ncbi:interferon-induced, double-stranded RNA-activated protein kinase-like [Gadus macrocephalus]|uniref:interferon-induced, double-stranded RNA-activated protein kinase-like n=1 Tax=Gadus macrocephalus TaxID=80720 RepID=UPI0028CB6794|nr:interferon-induced, double-stranded RNA-activated protein kinase-like [Gadus macrocephalus]
MESINYIAKLNEYVQKSGCELKYDVGSEGPAHIKMFAQTVILNGKPYPKGVGKNKKEARQNAAKHALESVLETDSDHSHVSGWSMRDATEPINQARLTQPTTMELGHTKQCYKFVLDGTEYPSGSGRTKKEAKEDAARLVYEKKWRNPLSNTVDQSSSVEPSSPQTNELNQDMSEGIGSPANMEVSLGELSGLSEFTYLGMDSQHQQENMCNVDLLVKRCGPAHCPQEVIGGREYPEVEGKTAKKARKRTAKEAWPVLQELLDCDSKANRKSAKSEEDGTNNKATSDTASSTSGSWIQFSNSSAPPKEEKLGIKAKIKLGEKFKKEPSDTPRGPTTSKFLTEYDNFECIGQGGYGHVHKARMKHLDTYYAVKMVLNEENALREAKILAKLQHPNIVRYYTSWTEDQENIPPNCKCLRTSQSSSDTSRTFLYIQMELCEMKDLEAWIIEKNSLHQDTTRKKESLDIMMKMICGVEYIHSQNLMHRDLKPSNIMVGSDGEVKIVDFGLVTAESDEEGNVLEKTMGRGTKSFMPPEQRYKNVYNNKVDIFASGLVYFLMLLNISGHERTKSWDDIRKQKFPADFTLSFPKESFLIKSMLHENPESRPSAEEITANLERLDFPTGRPTRTNWADKAWSSAPY